MNTICHGNTIILADLSQRKQAEETGFVMVGTNLLEVVDIHRTASGTQIEVSHF